MGLLPAADVSTGVSRVLRGLREGDQRTLLTGAAILALAYWRRTRPPERELLARYTIPKGQSVIVRTRGSRPVEITRLDG